MGYIGEGHVGVLFVPLVVGIHDLVGRGEGAPVRNHAKLEKDDRPAMKKDPDYSPED